MLAVEVQSVSQRRENEAQSALRTIRRNYLKWLLMRLKTVNAHCVCLPKRSRLIGSGQTGTLLGYPESPPGCTVARPHPALLFFSGISESLTFSCNRSAPAFLPGGSFSIVSARIVPWVPFFGFTLVVMSSPVICSCSLVLSM